MAKRRLQILMMPLVMLLLLVSCSKENRQMTGNVFDEANIPAAEKLILKAVEVYDTPRILTLTDSLEKEGDISAVAANLYLSIAAINQRNEKLAEKYLKDATANRQPGDADLRPYLKASALLARILASGGKYELALAEAKPTLAMMDSLGYSQYDDKTLLTIAIGDSQQHLHREKAAASTFEETYRMLRQWMDADTTGREFRRIFARFDNIVTCYFYTSQFDRVKLWLNREDSVLTAYSSRPDVSAEQLDRYRCILSLDLAEASQQLGHADEAKRYYQQFQETEFSKSTLSRINATDYLSLAGRYQEAVKNYELLDSVMAEWNIDKSLDNIGSYLLPKIRANVMAGRKDSALAVGMKLFECYDSVLTRQKQDDAAELATIYDTKGKETLIAQQEARLSRGRFTVLVVAIVLLTILFAIYIVYRQRTSRKLAAANALLEQKNEQLVMANARAEESARMKTDFIKKISHEIRTPLNILSGFTQIVTTPGMELDDDTKHDISRQITENTERITGLVDKMQELSEANSHTVIARTDRITPVQIATQAADTSAIKQARNLTFILQVAPEAERAVLQTSLTAATRALTLLLYNAQKFTHPAEARRNTEHEAANAQVVLRVTAEDGKILFSVEDTGIGVPAAEAEHIFEEFVQLDEYYEGTGIGLTVARSLVRRLGGDIRLDTSYTGGARFVMHLPA